jgi:hypothetical protein
MEIDNQLLLSNEADEDERKARMIAEFLYSQKFTFLDGVHALSMVILSALSKIATKENAIRYFETLIEAVKEDKEWG